MVGLWIFKVLFISKKTCMYNFSFVDIFGTDNLNFLEIKKIIPSVLCCKISCQKKTKYYV